MIPRLGPGVPALSIVRISWSTPLLTAALVCVSLLAAAFALLLVRQRRVTVNTGRRGEQLLAELRAREEEDRHLLHRRLPAIVEAQTNQAVTVPAPCVPSTARTPTANCSW